MIGNPFTDVPELCTPGAGHDRRRRRRRAEREATRLARGVLAAALPHAGQADRARPRHRAGADASTGRSSSPMRRTPPPRARPAIPTLIIKALRDAGYGKRVLAQIVDPAPRRPPTRPASAPRSRSRSAARIDPARFTPMPVEAEVRLLSDGAARLETMKIAARCRADRGADLRQLHRRRAEPHGQPVRPRDVLRQRPRPARTST